MSLPDDELPIAEVGEWALEKHERLRKYVDIAGRPGKDHLFLVDGQGAKYFDCSQEPLPYYTDLRRDISGRPADGAAQALCFKVCELALKAQAAAELIHGEVEP